LTRTFIGRWHTISGSSFVVMS